MYTPKYTITNIILRNVSLIEATREVIENAALVPAWEARFRKDAVIRTVHYGTHLEGNNLSKEQVESMFGEDLHDLTPSAGGIIARERDIQEVLNYRQVLKFIDSRGVPVESTYGRVKTSYQPYDLKTLREIHGLVTDHILPTEERGQLRKLQVTIRDNATHEIIYRPPPSPAVQIQLSAYFEWINSPQSRLEDNPIIRAGITHWELVRIHPFTDGNGRTARAMTLLVLFQEGYDVKRFFSIEQYYDQNPHDYYRALKATAENLDGDITRWLEYFTDGLAIELTRVKDRVLALSRDIKLKSRLGQQIALSERQIKILEYMEANRGILTTKSLASAYPMVSRDTLLRDMNDLMQKKIVRKIGITKGARYILKE